MHAKRHGHRVTTVADVMALLCRSAISPKVDPLSKAAISLLSNNLGLSYSGTKFLPLFNWIMCEVDIIPSIVDWWFGFQLAWFWGCRWPHRRCHWAPRRRSNHSNPSWWLYRPGWSLGCTIPSRNLWRGTIPTYWDNDVMFTGASSLGRICTTTSSFRQPRCPQEFDSWVLNLMLKVFYGFRSATLVSSSRSKTFVRVGRRVCWIYLTAIISLSRGFSIYILYLIIIIIIIISKLWMPPIVATIDCCNIVDVVVVTVVGTTSRLVTAGSRVVTSSTTVVASGRSNSGCIVESCDLWGPTRANPTHQSRWGWYCDLEPPRRSSSFRDHWATNPSQHHPWIVWLQHSRCKYTHK